MVTNLSRYFSFFIRHQMNKFCISDEQLASQAGISVSNLDRILEDKYPPSLAVLERLLCCVGLQVEIYESLYSKTSHELLSSQVH